MGTGTGFPAVSMFCPKCGGGTYITDEELIQVVDKSRPSKAVIKVLYVCRACAERFSRLIHEDLEKKKRDERGVSQPGYNQQQDSSYKDNSENENRDSLKFF